MKGTIFLILFLTFTVLIYKGKLSLEPVFLGAIKYYKFLIVGFLILLLLFDPKSIKKMIKGKQKKINPDSLVQEYNFVNHVRDLTEKANNKNKEFENEKITSILEIQRGLCNSCAKSIDKYNSKLDLKKPISLGGNTDLNNLQVLCINCYNEKMSINTFLK